MQRNFTYLKRCISVHKTHTPAPLLILVMDNHFRNVFDIGTSTKSFIPSTSFSGSRKGYVFQLGDKGLGYYYDEFQNEPMPEHVSFILGDCSRFSHFII